MNNDHTRLDPALGAQDLAIVEIDVAQEAGCLGDAPGTSGTGS